jgi:hypothetical protein
MFEKGRELMRPLRLACFALLVGVLTNCVAHGQPPGYGSPQPPQQSDPYGRGYDDRYDDGRYYGAPAPRVEVGFFYDELSPYGDWVRTRDYGWAWFPRDVHPYWRPYHDGRWVITEYGWTWISYEPFGWATYHYGRWARDPRFGWIWIPGTVWGPAWVSWQYGGGYVGWAPLPPAVSFEIGIGLRLGGFDLRLGIRPDYYNFVPERRFLDPRLSSHYLPSARNVTIINNTTNITNYTYIDNRVINQGVDRRRIEQATGTRVVERRVAEVRTKVRSEVATEEVRIYRPEKQKLDTVRVERRDREKAEQRAAPRQEPRADQRPAAQRRDAPEIVVAPRVDRAPRPDTRQIEQRERREKQELERYLAEEKQKIEKLHRDEDAKVRAQAERAKEASARASAQAERAQVEKRHQAEREALRLEEREAAQQLEARQKAKREAVVAEPPAKAEPQGKAKATRRPQGKGRQGEGQGKGRQGEGRQGKGREGEEGQGSAGEARAAAGGAGCRFELRCGRGEQDEEIEVTREDGVRRRAADRQRRRDGRE